MTHHRAAFVTLLAIMIAAFTLTACMPAKSAQAPHEPFNSALGIQRTYDSTYKVACYWFATDATLSCVKVGQ